MIVLVIFELRECYILIYIQHYHGICTWGIYMYVPTDLSRTEQNRTEQNGTERNRAEQSRAEQSRAEQSRTEQNRTEQNRTEQNRTAQHKKWNESGFRPLLCTYRLNRARWTSRWWWDEWDDTALQTQDSSSSVKGSGANHYPRASARHITSHHITSQSHHTTPHYTTPHHTTPQHNTTQHNTKHNTTQHNTTQYIKKKSQYG